MVTTLYQGTPQGLFAFETFFNFMKTRSDAELLDVERTGPVCTQMWIFPKFKVHITVTSYVKKNNIVFTVATTVPDPSGALEKRLTKSLLKSAKKYMKAR